MSENKNFREHELVKRYVYDVTRRISEKQRKDIGDELEGLIEDMILEKLAEEDKAGISEKTEDEVVKAVLMQMGDPAKLARKYRGEEEHLIGGEYYHIYCLILKIVLACAAFGYIVSAVVSFFVSAVTIDGTTQIVNEQINHFMSLPGVLISVFGAVTLFFAFMEKTKVKIWDTVKWDVSKLPAIPFEKKAIKRSDCIVNIVFDVLFLSLFAFAPTFIGVWLVADGRTICIPIFNLEIWPTLLPIFVVSFLAGAIKDVVKMLEGCYNRVVLITTILANAISVVCTIAIFSILPLWNPNFVSQLKEAYAKTEYAMAEWSKGDLVVYFGSNEMSLIFILLIFMGIAIDTIVTIYKSLGRKNLIS